MSLGDTECALITTLWTTQVEFLREMTEMVITLSPLKHHNGAGEKGIACE